MKAFPEWIIILIVIIVLSKIAAPLARRSGVPVLSVQLFMGILLGPSLVNILEIPIVLGSWGSLSPGPRHDVLKILAEVGLIQLMFLAGLEVDWAEMRKIGKPIFSAGTVGFLLTATVVVIVTRSFVDRWAEALAVGAIMGVSSFGISANYFTEMKSSHKRIIQGMMGVAILSGILAILLMTASLAMNYGMTYGGFRMIIAVSWFLAKLIMFFAIAYFLTSQFLRHIARSGFGKRPRQMLVGYLLLVASLYAWAAMHLGSFAAVGVASLGGALLGTADPELKERIERGLRSVLASIPVGVFFVVLGMEMNLRGSERSMILLTVLLAAVIGAKWMGYWLAMRRAGEPFEDRFLVGLGILPQGEMGMLIAAYLFSRGVIDPRPFSITITITVILTMVAPILMKALP